MARGVNKVILIGTVGRDPEVKYMPSGGAVVNLSIATNESWKDKQTGEKKERTEWHKLVFYNRLAEVVGEYVRKGSQLYVEGRLRTRNYQKDGQEHYVTEVMVDEMQMLGGRGGDSGQTQGRQEQEPRRPATGEPAGGGDFQDDDIPF